MRCILKFVSDAELLTDAQRFEALVLRVLDVLTRFDIEGLHPGDRDWAPLDEYLFEAQSFAQLVDENGSVDVNDVREVWMHWFSNDASRLTAVETAQLVAALNNCVVVDTDPR